MAETIDLVSLVPIDGGVWEGVGSWIECYGESCLHVWGLFVELGLGWV